MKVDLSFPLIEFELLVYLAINRKYTTNLKVENCKAVSHQISLIFCPFFYTL